MGEVSLDSVVIIMRRLYCEDLMRRENSHLHSLFEWRIYWEGFMVSRRLGLGEEIRKLTAKYSSVRLFWGEFIVNYLSLKSKF